MHWKEICKPLKSFNKVSFSWNVYLNCFLPALWKFLVMHGQANSIQDFYGFVSNILFYFFFVFRNECIASRSWKVKKVSCKRTALCGKYDIHFVFPSVVICLVIVIFTCFSYLYFTWNKNGWLFFPLIDLNIAVIVLSSQGINLQMIKSLGICSLGQLLSNMLHLEI